MVHFGVDSGGTAIIAAACRDHHGQRQHDRQTHEQDLLASHNLSLAELDQQDNGTLHLPKARNIADAQCSLFWKRAHDKEPGTEASRGPQKRVADQRTVASGLTVPSQGSYLLLFCARLGEASATVARFVSVKKRMLPNTWLCAEEGVLVTGEGEEADRHRDARVDASYPTWVRRANSRA